MRGEIATTDVPPRVERVAFDVLGYHVLLTQQPASAEEIAGIADDVYLPSPMPTAAAGGRAAATSAHPR